MKVEEKKLRQSIREAWLLPSQKSMAKMAMPYKSVTTPVKPVQLVELKGNPIHLTGSIDFCPQKSPFQMERGFARKTDKSTQNICISPLP